MADKEKVIGIKVDVKTAQKNVKELNQSFEAQTDLIDELEADLMKYEQVLKNTSKTNLAARKNANDAITRTKDRLKEEKFALNTLNKDRKKANNTLKEATTNQRDYSGALSLVDRKTGGAISGFKNLISTISGATKGFNLMKIAIIGTGIGALLIAITSIVAAFKSSEAGQNKFAKLMGVIGSVVGNVVDVLSDLGEFIIDLFSGDGAAMSKLKSFGASIFNVIGLPLKNVIDTVKSLGKVLGALFSGDVSGAFDALKQGVEDIKGNFNEASDSINGATDALKKFGEEAIKEAEIAGQIADKRAAADKLSRKLVVERAEAEKKISELREKSADKEKYSAKQRIEFLKEAGAVNEELAAKEIKISELRLKAKSQENALSKSTKEDLDEEAKLKADLINKETQKNKLQKALTAELTTSRREANAQAVADKKAADDEIKALAKEKESALEAIRVGAIDTEDERRAEELRKVEEQYKALIEAAKKYNIGTEELEAAQKTKTDELKEKHKQEDDARQTKIDEDKKAKLLKDQEAKLEQLELDKEFELLNFEEQREILNARTQTINEDEILNEEQKSKALEDIANANVKINELENKQKEEASLQYLAIAGNISNLLGKESEAGKALAVATTLVSTYVGAQKAYEGQMAITTPDAPVRAALAAGVAVAGGLANVKSILSVNAKGEKGAKGGGGGLSAASSGTVKRIQAASTNPQDSSFDSVGNEQSSRNAQAQSNANAQGNSPIRAYVTSTDVVSGAQFERNRVDVAGF